MGAMQATRCNGCHRLRWRRASLLRDSATDLAVVLAGNRLDLQHAADSAPPWTLAAAHASAQPAHRSVEAEHLEEGDGPQSALLPRRELSKRVQEDEPADGMDARVGMDAAVGVTMKIKLKPLTQTLMRMTLSLSYFSALKGDVFLMRRL